MDLLGAVCTEIAQYSDSTEVGAERNFVLRKKALDAIAIVKKALKNGSYYNVAISLEQRIININQSISEKYQKQILNAVLSKAALREVFDRFTDYKKWGFHNASYSEDDLDGFIDTIFGLNVEAVRILSSRDEMVHLERTPARTILEFIDRLALTGMETVYDLGSGIGHVLLMFGLLTDVNCVGIEIEEIYYQASKQLIDSWHIPNVSILNTDVQETDLQQGDVFFMYSPFFGKVLSNVLAKLQDVAKMKTIRICSYGNSTIMLAKESWLHVEDTATLNPYCAAIFESSYIE